MNLFLLAAVTIIKLTGCNTHPRPAVDANSLNAEVSPANHTDTLLKDPLDTASSTVTRFFLAAGAGNRLEIALGTIAQENAHSTRVKKFGTMMVKDHLKSNKKLISLAEDHHIRIPTQVSAKIQFHIDEISRFKGDEFDRRYMILMTDQHQKQYDLFEKTSRHLRDTTFIDYISKNLSLLRLHLDSAKAIKNEL